MPRCPAGCKEERDKWVNGCLRDAPHTVFVSSCPRCRGFDTACTVCEGHGRKEWRRCPASQVTPDVWALVDSYIAYDRSGALPETGAYLDQSRIWTRWVAVMDVERAKIDEENRPKRGVGPRPRANADSE